MKQYYYNLFLSSGEQFLFYCNRKVLIAEYKSIVEHVMTEISAINDKDEPYICTNDNFYKLLIKEMNSLGFKTVTTKLVNYDIKNLSLY